MSCFSLPYLEHLFILIIVIGAVIAIVRLFLPSILGWFGAAGGLLQRALEIILYAVILIFVVIIVFELLNCLLGAGLPRLR